MAPLINIAMADDHLLLRTGLCMLIKEFDNMRIVTDAGNGKELIANINALPQPPDICILDIRMPQMNGLETLIELKRRWPDIKVLMLSVFVNELSIIKLMRNGADGYVIKNCHPSELRDAIHHVYHGGVFYPKELLEKMPIKAQDPATFFPDITTKEYTFLAYCGTELTYKEIATRMNQSLRTIEGYRDHLLKKLNLRSRVGLAIFALESGIACMGKIA